MTADTKADTSKLRIRPTTAEDGGKVHQLVERTGVLDLNSSYAYILACDVFGSTCVVAEEGERILGFVTGFLEPDDPDTIFLWQVGVDPDAQGRGLGSKLLDAFVRTETGKRSKTLHTTISPSNEASQALFESFGRRHEAEVKIVGEYAASLFPDSHEPEKHYRIGPLTRKDD